MEALISDIIGNFCGSWCCLYGKRWDDWVQNLKAKKKSLYKMSGSPGMPVSTWYRASIQTCFGSAGAEL